MSDLRRGFSLIELLIVVTIITILGSIGMVNYQTFSQKTRDAKRKADLEQIRAALELYRADVGEYPETDDLSSCGAGEKISNGTIDYMTDIPCDPKYKENGVKAAYPYARDASNSLRYEIGALLEIDENLDTSCSNNMDGECTNATGNAEDCNYCVKNP
jgi:general secretion pathway protein G